MDFLIRREEAHDVQFFICCLTPWQYLRLNHLTFWIPNCNKFLNPFTIEKSCLKGTFLQCQCIKINSNFKILLYYWSPIKFGSIFTCWHVKKDDFSNWMFFSQTKIAFNILTWGTLHEYFGLGRMCVFDANSFKYNLITKHDFPFHFQVRQIIHVIGN